MAKAYFQTEDFMGFWLRFSALDEETKEAYYQKMYDEDRIDFLSMTAEYMDPENCKKYLEKAWEDNRVSFFATLLAQMQMEEGEALGDYVDIEKYYEDDDITWFCILTDYMTAGERKIWLDRAEKDGNINYYYVLKDKCEKDFRGTMTERMSI